jgi:hypothetical protein
LHSSRFSTDILDSTDMTVSVAIAGAGKGSTPFSANLGSRIAKALLARGADVKILLRATSVRSSELL